MPISFSQLKANLRSINVSYYSDNFVVQYRPSELTPQSASEVQARIDSGEGENVLIETLCRVMTSWEVTDDNGDMLPINAETLSVMPGPLLLAISEAIGEDSRPKPKSARGSFAR
jgi:hypothetical protein